VPIAEGVSQISPPIRILLVCAVAFLAAWMLFLKPKSASTPTPAAATPAPNVQTGAPAQTGFGKAVQLAQGAAAKESGQAPAAGSSSTTSTTSTTTTTTATGAHPAAKQTAPALPAASLRGLPKDVAAALQARKVLVLGVFSTGADDKAVRSALKGVDRHHGKVFVKDVAVGQLASYHAVVGDLSVNQTPSVVIVDRKLRGTTIPGYLDGVAIDQAIQDSL
jgi:cytoskeletal protein RodZ